MSWLLFISPKRVCGIEIAKYEIIRKNIYLHRIYHYYFPGAPTKEKAVFTKKILDKFCRYNYVLEHRIPRSSAHAFCSYYSCYSKVPEVNTAHRTRLYSPLEPA